MSKFPIIYAFMFLKIGFIKANSADPDEMLPYAAFHLEFHCLPKYLFIEGLIVSIEFTVISVRRLAAHAQYSLCNRTVSPKLSLLAYTKDHR